MVKCSETTRDITSYDKSHCPPTHTFHPTTKRELKHYHLKNKKSFQYHVPGSFDDIEDRTNDKDPESLRLTMLKQEYEMEEKEGFPNYHLEDTWINKM
ncbi:hypothetical protein ABK040_007604 [Willaertia magna]